jgi:hypothetical protein
MIDPEDAMRLSEAIKPLLAGQDEDAVGAALADLTSIWIASHFAGSPAETKAYRKIVLKAFVKLVLGLIEPSEQQIIDKMVDKSAPQ